MKRSMASALVGTLLALAPAHAGIGEGNGEVGFDLGFTNFDSDVTNEDGTNLGLRGGYHFTRLFELEGQVAGYAAEEAGVDIGLGVFLVNAVFSFHPRGTIVPYVLAGVGQATLEFDIPGLGTVDDDGRAFQVAAGARLFFGARKKVAVRIELSSLQERTFDESSRHGSLNVGFTWRIGEMRAP